MISAKTLFGPTKAIMTKIARVGAASPGSASPDEPVIVEAVGELDVATLDAFQGSLKRAVRNTSSFHVVVDLRHVTFIDSTTLGLLVEVQQRLTSQGRRLTIRTQQPLLLRLFEITGLTAQFEIRA